MKRNCGHFLLYFSDSNRVFRPEMFFWKLNANATWNTVNKSSGLGWVLRYHLGHIWLASLKFILHCYEVKILEAMAISFSLESIFHCLIFLVYWLNLIVWRLLICWITRYLILLKFLSLLMRWRLECGYENCLLSCSTQTKCGGGNSFGEAQIFNSSNCLPEWLNRCVCNDVIA